MIVRKKEKAEEEVEVEEDENKKEGVDQTLTFSRTRFLSKQKHRK